MEAEHNKRKLRILEIVFKNPLSIPGGLEVYALNISKEFLKHGHLVDFTFVEDEDLPVLKEYMLNGLDNKFNFIGFRISKVWNYLGLVKLVYSLKLRKFAKVNKNKYDILHINGDNGGLVCYKHSIPCVMTSHGDSKLAYLQCKGNIKGFVLKKYVYATHKISYFLENFGYSNADKITVVSIPLLKLLEKKFNDRDIVYTPPSIDIEKAHKLEIDKFTLRKKEGYESKFYALFIGKSPLKKGLKTAIQAVMGCKQFNLIAITSGIEDNNKYAEKAKFLSNVSNEELNNLYNLCDLLVFPSAYEGLPTVVIEAMSCGLIPVVYGNIASNIPEIKNGINSFVVNSEKEFIDVLKHVELMQPEEIKNMSLNAVRSIEGNYSSVKLAETFLDIFYKISSDNKF